LKCVLIIRKYFPIQKIYFIFAYTFLQYIIEIIGIDMKKIRFITYKSLVFILALSIYVFFLAGCNSDNSVAPNDKVSEKDIKQEIVKLNVTITAKAFFNFASHLIDNENAENYFRFYVKDNLFFEDSTGYYFVEDLEANMIAHGVNPDLVGQNRYDVKDENGKYYVREMLDSINTRGQGTISYYFLNPTTLQQQEKTAFVYKVPLIDMFVGSGYYETGQFEELTKMEANKQIIRNVVHSSATGLRNIIDNNEYDDTQKDALMRIYVTDIVFFDDSTGYFFIYNIDGTCVAHPMQRDIEGVNRIDHTDSNGKEYIREMCEIAITPGFGFIDYQKKNFETGAVEPKMSYIERIPGTDYFIGAGVYLGE
jgi:signal transduction histidine kinase